MTTLIRSCNDVFGVSFPLVAMLSLLTMAILLEIVVEVAIVVD